MIDCSFEKYLDIMRNEFSRTTIHENQDRLLINVRGRVPMNPTDIEKGIEIGKKIISKRKKQEDLTYREERTI